MQSDFNSEMLSVGREFRGLSQTQLAKLSLITQSQLSKLENGIVQPDQELIEKFSCVLELPKSFFYQGGRIYGAPMSIHAMFRKSQQIPKKKLSKVTAELNLRLISVKKLLNSVDLEAAFKIPSYDIEDGLYSPSEVANLVRKAWLIKPGPIKDLTSLVESAGIIVSFSDFSQANVDGVTITLPGLPPCIFINRNRPSDRQRFSLAHELGHIIMHSQPNERMEDQANEFASAFLLPEREFRQTCIGKFDIPLLATLKRHWRVSMQAALYRSRALGIISDNQSSYLWRKMSTLGYRTNEPPSTNIPSETPQTLSMIIKTHTQELGYSLDDICEALSLYEDDFFNLMPSDGIFPPKKKNTLRLVKS